MTTIPTVDLYEDNAGHLYLAWNGQAWEIETSRYSDFADDAESLTAGIVDTDDLDDVDLDDLIEQTHLSHDATRHVATWTAGAVTVHGRPGGAAARYLNENA